MLTTLYLVAPAWLLRLQAGWLGITPEAAHEWLCPALGCRCADLSPAA